MTAGDALRAGFRDGLRVLWGAFLCAAIGLLVARVAYDVQAGNWTHALARVALLVVVLSWLRRARAAAAPTGEVEPTKRQPGA